MLFWRCFVMGFSIAAPIGPIGMLCLQTTARVGRRAGLLTGLGAACADAVYGAVAAFGITAVTATLTAAGFWLRLLGGAFLLWMGVKGLSAARRPDPPPMLTSPFAGTFFLTLTNPLTILSFIAIFGSMGAAESPLAAVGGVFAGSMAWWLILTAAAGALLAGRNFDRLLSLISAAVLTAFGLHSLWQVLRP